MALFGKKKKDDFVDLGERLRKQQERVDSLRTDMSSEPAAPVVETATLPQNTSVEPASSASSSGSNFFGNFFGGGNQTSPSPKPIESDSFTHMTQSTETPFEKKRKLAKRLSDITKSLESLSNAVYKMEQRLDLIERKLNLNRY